MLLLLLQWQQQATAAQPRRLLLRLQGTRSFFLRFAVTAIAFFCNGKHVLLLQWQQQATAAQPRRRYCCYCCAFLQDQAFCCKGHQIDGFSNCMLVVFFAKEGACPLKAAFFPTAFQTACLLLFLRSKNNNKHARRLQPSLHSKCLLLPLHALASTSLPARRCLSSSSSAFLF